MADSSPMSEFTSFKSDDDDARKNERFHLFPKERLEAVSMVSGFVGVGTGFYEGIKHSSLRYLTENGHRLPRTVGGWYFYHKKKNYVMILQGCKDGLKQGTKFSIGVTTFFGIELLIDKYLRNNTIDFLNTTGAGMLMAGIYGSWNRLSRVQTIGYIRKGGLLGLSMGFAQDLMIWTRGGRIWYIDKLGIKNPRIQNSNQNLNQNTVKA